MARFAAGFTLFATSVVSAAGAQGAAVSAPQDRFVIEYYYKVRWGHQQEFFDLFRKNHLPLLDKEVEKGRILEVTMVGPRHHGTEDGRWDYRVTIVYPNVAAAHAPSPVTEAERRRLFPDSGAFEREERRRFEILEAHWDLPIIPLRLRP